MTAVAFLATFYVRQWIALGTLSPGLLPPWLAALEVPVVENTSPYMSVLFGIIPVWGIAFYASNTSDFRSTYRETALRYARALGLGLSVFLGAFFLLKLQFMARTFVVMFAVSNYLLLMLGRFIVMESVAFVRHKRVDGHRVAIVGCGDNGVAVAQHITSQPPWNVRLIGHLSVPGDNPRHPGIFEFLGPVNELAELLDRTPVDEVLFASPNMDDETLANALHACDERGVDVLLPLPPSIPQRSRIELNMIDGFDTPLLGLRRTPTSEVGLALKRLMDILVSGIMLLLASPVMLVTAIIIKLTSDGPIFFQQERSGRQGRRFTMFKFRSMVVDAEARKKELAHLNEMSGPVFKITRDPRVTRIGQIIRKTSIDELPQLFNILRGDMSLVGPRPPLPSEVDQYQPWQRRRLSVKPGLTGLWQVSGRNNVDFEEWMAMDLRYIDDWSLWLDMKIILRTVPAVLFRAGAS
ncbi:MAG: sugar transferase [Myxococcota bacterium]